MLNRIRITKLPFALPDEMVRDPLQKVLSEFGTVKDIYLVKQRHSGLVLGRAYVVFESEAEARKALALDGKTIQGCAISVTLDESDYQVKFTNLPFGVQPEMVLPDLQKIFTRYGDVKNIEFEKGAYSGLPKRRGYVTYVKTEQAKKALEANISDVIMGTSLKVVSAREYPSEQEDKK